MTRIIDMSTMDVYYRQQRCSPTSAREYYPGGSAEKVESYETLFLQVLIRLAVVDVAFLVLQLLHSLLFEDLITSLAFEFLGH